MESKLRTFRHESVGFTGRRRIHGLNGVNIMMSISRQHTLRASIGSAFLTFLASIAPLGAQTGGEHPGIHRLELETHRSVIPDTIDDHGQLAAPSPLGPATRTSKRVFGYRPYWATANDHLGYDYGVLDVLGHFAAEVDTATGGLSTLRGWPNVPAIPYARDRGVKPVLVAVSFGYDANDRILGNLARRNTLVESLVAVVKSAGGGGVNIDFESVRGTQRANLVELMRTLANRMRAEVPGAEISMALPAVDWSNAFDLAALSSICDYVILMGYDFHYAGSPTAGPVAPLAGESYNVTCSVETYLAAGVPPQKLLLGVPWYGYDWPVVDSLRGSATTGSARSVFYNDAETAAAQYGKRYDATTGSAWYTYSTFSGWRQVWYDDSLSLAMKYRLVKEKGLGGIGIWALSYEKGRREIWAGIAQAFGGASDVALEESEDVMMEAVGGRLRFTAPRAGHLTVQCVDLLGRVISTPVEGRIEAGAQSVELGRLPAGRYFVVVRGEGIGGVLPVMME